MTCALLLTTHQFDEIDEDETMINDGDDQEESGEEG
jgi:hypothetical protein